MNPSSTWADVATIWGLVLVILWLLYIVGNLTLARKALHEQLDARNEEIRGLRRQLLITTRWKGAKHQ